MLTRANHNFMLRTIKHFIVLMDQIIKKKEVIKMQKIQEKHLLKETEWRASGYIDQKQIDQKQSYYLESRPRIYGGCYVYQYITMLDGTTYELSSMTSSTRGIVAYNCKGKNILQREIKRLTKNAIDY